MHLQVSPWRLFHLSQGAGNPALDVQYHMLDQMVSASYVCSMDYWIVSFAQKVPERREFTPQMQNFLLALAGNARSDADGDDPILIRVEI